ncbi:MFS transporter [Hyalangium sp.]|uniref:MFS transporter n=1 Tax=Hyalangium sp. TaxID=2028555 RepID=UPI002D376ECC|nr:MFS transporter [Hyalangium sp.]HYH99588.1 MFS transporter [Hyalangium sp.]
MSTVENAQVGYFELLRNNHAFRWLWLSRVISQLGDWFTAISLYAMLMELTGKGQSIGLLLVAILLPGLLFGPVGGMVADRLDRKKVIFICCVLRGVIVLGLLWVRQPEHVWLIYALRFTQSSVTAMFDASENAAIGSVLARNEVVTGNTIVYGITWSAMLALGALAGGLTAAWLGRSMAFIIDSATFFAAAACVSRVSLPRREPSSQAGSWAGALGIQARKEALRLLFHDRGVRLVLFAKAGWGLAGGGIMLLYSVFGARVFPVANHADIGIGLLYAARGVGAMLGAPVARRIGGSGERSLVRGIGACFFVMMTAFALFAVAPSLLWASLFLIIANMGVSTLWVYSSSLINLWVPNETRGRAFAADSTLFTSAMILSSGLTGLVIDGFGLTPQQLQLGLAALLLLPTVGWWLGARRYSPAAPAPARLEPDAPG